MFIFSLVKYLSLFIFILLWGCRPMGVPTIAPKHIADTISCELMRAWQESPGNTTGFIDWLNNNGGYMLAFQYLEDSLKQTPCNALALQGADIAWQHGYLQWSLSFLQQYIPHTEGDTLTRLFRERRIFLSQIHTWRENPILAAIDRHIPYIMADSQLRFQYLSDMGMHYHNIGRYDTAVRLNTCAYELVHERKYAHSDVAMCCQRLGNDYNDMIRKGLVAEKDRLKVYNKAAALYEECIAELEKVTPLPVERIANCYFTYNFLVRAGRYKPNFTTYYRKAIEYVIPNYATRKPGSPLFCLHPLLASITFTHLGECNFYDNLSEKNAYKSADCITSSQDCLQLFDQVIAEPTEDGVHADMLRTYSQRSTAQMIDYKLGIEPDKKGLDLEFLYLSNASKYGMLNKQYAIAKDSSIIAPLAQYTSVLSLQFVAYTTQNKRLQALAQWIADNTDEHKALATVRPPHIDNKYISRLQQKCAEDNCAIIDLKITGDKLLTTLIDKDTIQNMCQPAGNSLIYNSDTVQKLMHLNNAALYDDVAFRLYTNLFGKLLNKKYRQLIIIPAPGMPPLAFDALVYKRSYKSNWTDLNYLGDKMLIYTVPRIDWILSRADNTLFKLFYLQTNFTSSLHLPYNNELKQYLTVHYDASYIESKELKQVQKVFTGIIHIASHTKHDTIGSVNLLLQNNALNPMADRTVRCKMAVLNTCEADLGVHYTSEGNISLARLFIANGADAVITSTGKVDNHASTALFERFYEYLYSGVPVAQSLRMAKQDIRKKTPEWANPYYWASYELSGKNLTFYH